MGIYSSMSKSAGGREGRETLFFRSLEICSVSDRECCPECCCGIAGNVCEGLLVLRALGPHDIPHRSG